MPRGVKTPITCEYRNGRYVFDMSVDEAIQLGYSIHEQVQRDKSYEITCQSMAKADPEFPKNLVTSARRTHRQRVRVANAFQAAIDRCWHASGKTESGDR